MAITSSIITKNKPITKKYPYIGKYINVFNASNTFYVLFNKQSCGMVIYSTSTQRYVGDYCIDWVEDDFEMTTNEIRLLNQE